MLRAVVVVFTMAVGWTELAKAQQPVQGFAVERFYPSVPGGGWFVMDDLNMSGGFGGAISLAGGYAGNPLTVRGPGGIGRLDLVTGESFVDIGVAATYDRYRVYLNLPVPVSVTGNSGVLGGYVLTVPAVSLGSNPDTISDTRLGFDVRFFGEPDSKLRVGASAQLIFPSGARSDYVSDARYGGMLRFLAAGDSGKFTYAGQVGVHLRSLNNFPVSDSPAGNEVLFGVSAGRSVLSNQRWAVIVGPEFFGESAIHSYLIGQSGFEGLLSGRLEGTGSGRHLRFKLGAGHSIVQHFGTPEWRVLAAVEVFGRRPK